MGGLGVFLFIASLIFSGLRAHSAARVAKRRRQELQDALNRSDGHLINYKSKDFRYPLAYGKCRMGGNRAYEATSGPGDRYYHQILNIGMGPMEGIVRQDGSIYTTTGTLIPTSNPPLIYLDGKLWTQTNMAGNCHFEWFNGADDQTVCTTLQNAVSQAQWDMTQRHKAYLYCRFDYDKDLFLGVPEVTVVVAGL